MVGKINRGLAVYVGIENNDEISDLEWGIKKITGLRIFDDKEGKMNLPIDLKMGILVISQFTLHGNLKKKDIDLLSIGQRFLLLPPLIMINSSRC